MNEEKYDCKVKIPIENIKKVLEGKRIDFAQLVEYVKNDIFNSQKTEFVLCLDKSYKTWVCLPTSIYKEKDNVKEYIAKAKKTIPDISKCNEIVFNNFGRYVILCDKVIFRFKSPYIPRAKARDFTAIFGKYNQNYTFFYQYLFLVLNSLIFLMLY